MQKNPGLVRLLFLFMAGYFVSGIQPAHAGNDQWMKDLSIETPSALDRKLSEFIFPGTHDSGTYALQPKAACEACTGSDNVRDIVDGGDEACRDFIDTLDVLDIGLPHSSLCFDTELLISTLFLPFAQAQEKSMAQQLDEGARFFDLRFFSHLSFLCLVHFLRFSVAKHALLLWHVK